MGRDFFVLNAAGNGSPFKNYNHECQDSKKINLSMSCGKNNRHFWMALLAETQPMRFQAQLRDPVVRWDLAIPI